MRVISSWIQLRTGETVIPQQKPGAEIKKFANEVQEDQVSLQSKEGKMNERKVAYTELFRC